MSDGFLSHDRKPWKGLAVVALGALALFGVVACPDRSLPSAPQAAAHSAPAGTEEEVARMPIVRVVRTPRFGGPAPTSTVTTAATSGPTRTKSPTALPMTPTSTRTPTPIRTPTPTQPAGPTIIRLKAQRYIWRWVAGPGANGNSADITLKSGQTYTLKVFDADCPDLVLLPHYFSGNAFLGVSGVQLAYGSDCTHLAPDQSQTFTAPVVTAPTQYSFLCMEGGCGNTTQHESMTGLIIVVP